MVTRLLHVEGAPVVVRASSGATAPCYFERDGATARRRKVAMERMRFALGVDDD